MNSSPQILLAGTGLTVATGQPPSSIRRAIKEHRLIPDYIAGRLALFRPERAAQIRQLLSGCEQPAEASK